MNYLSCCPCINGKSTKARLKNNSFERMRSKVVVSGFSSLEGKCELIGIRYCELIDNGEITLDKIIEDIIDFSRIHAENTEGVQLAWLALHLSLGLLYQYKCSDKNRVREVIREMLIYSRGIDMGLFMRDLLHSEDYTAKNEIIDKSLYCMRACSGFKVDLRKDNIADRIYAGPCRVHYQEMVNLPWCYYFQLPMGHPTLSMTGHQINDHVGTTPLFMAIEELKANLVLLLLQHGASPEGRPLEQLLLILSSHELVTGTNSTIADAPMEIIQQCLTYCLRAIPRLSVNFDGQVVADLRRKEDAPYVYFLREKAAAYMPDDMYKSPASLKHMSRCAIRSTFLSNDHIPEGIDKLSSLQYKPELVTYLKLMS